ncbi:helix-turn-helix domain-containing protein [Enterococcus sp. LJL99]
MRNKLRGLLSPSNQIVDILSKSIFEKENWISIAELSQLHSLSTRTVQRYVNKLNDLVIDFNEEKNQSIQFEISKAHGVRFVNNSEITQAMLEKYIFLKDKDIQLLIYLLFNKGITKKEYCEKYMLTEFTLAKSIKKVNMFLVEFELKVSDKELSIIGKESQIRMICYSVTWVLFDAEEWPLVFSTIPENKITEAVTMITTELNLSLNFIKKRELAYLITIAMLRYRLGFTVSCSKEWLEYFPTENMVKLSNSVTKLMMNNHIVSNEEIYFLTINILTHSWMYIDNPFKRELIDFIQEDTIVNRATKLFLAKFSEEFCEIPIELYDEVVMFVYRSHLYAHLFKAIESDYNANSLLETIAKEHPHSNEKISKFLDCLYETSDFDLFLERKYLIQRYFMVEVFIKPELLLGTTITVLLETDLPEIYENIIKKLLYDRFKYEFKLIFLENDLLQKPDIRLSTIAAKKKNNDLTVLFDYPLSEKDYLYILKQLKQVQKSKG